MTLENVPKKVNMSKNRLQNITTQRIKPLDIKSVTKLCLLLSIQSHLL